MNRTIRLAGTFVALLLAIAAPAVASRRGGSPADAGEFERILRAVQPDADAAELDRRANELARLPGAASSFLQASSLPERSDVRSSLLARTAPLLPSRDVLACVRERAARHPDLACRRAALDLMRWHATAEELPLMGRLVLDERGHALEDPSLLDLLQDACVDVVRRDPRAIVRISAIVETAACVRIAFVHAVGIAGRSEGLSWLAEQIDDADVGADALQELGRLASRARSDERAGLAERVRPLLRSESAATRGHAIRALAALGDEVAIPELVEMLGAGSAGERKSALVALRELSGRALPADAEAWRAWHEAETRWLRESSPAVLARLSSTRESEVVAAVRTISEHGLERDRLAASLADLLRSHSSPVVRSQACLALARLRSTAALDALVLALEDAEPAVQAQAHAALVATTGLALPPDAKAWRTALGRAG